MLVKNMQKKADVKTSKTNSLEFNTLMKLRLVAIAIFALMTLSFILAVVLSNQFIIAAALMLISYIVVLALMVKLLIIKEL